MFRSLVVCLLLVGSVPLQAQDIPVKLSHVGADPVGRALVRAVETELERSDRLRLNDVPGAFSVRVMTMNPGEGGEDMTCFAALITVSFPDGQYGAAAQRRFIEAASGCAGRDRLSEAAETVATTAERSIFAFLDGVRAHIQSNG